MYKGKTFLGIIPARGGSKGLPNKNIKLLHGKPLIEYTIHAANYSKLLDDCVVSTDSEEIMNIAKESGGNVPFLRPDYLATDTATTFDAVEHAINFYKDTLNKEYDYIVLLEPTSPLREDDDIDNMIMRIVENDTKFDSIVSIGEVDEHPSILKKIMDDDSIIPYCDNLKVTNRRQDNDVAYFPYCVAYIAKMGNFLEEKTFYTKRNTYYKIKKHQCYEIDDIFNFLSIENIMKHLKEI